MSLNNRLGEMQELCDSTESSGGEVGIHPCSETLREVLLLAKQDFSTGALALDVPELLLTV